jgi:NADPH:quinone reductase-like Zn-dependent oxidoreductase
MRRLRRFIVRKQEQDNFLVKLGAKFVVNASIDTFKKDLYKAIDATGATLAFDAFGSLDFSLMLLNRAFGMLWSIVGWLLMRFFGKLARAEIDELKVYIEPE